MAVTLLAAEEGEEGVGGEFGEESGGGGRDDWCLCR